MFGLPTVMGIAERVACEGFFVSCDVVKAGRQAAAGSPTK